MSAPAKPVGTEEEACSGIAERRRLGVPQFAYVEALSDPAPGALPKHSSFRLIAVDGDVLTEHATVADLLWEGSSTGVALSTYELVPVTGHNEPPDDAARLSDPNAAGR